MIWFSFFFSSQAAPKSGVGAVFAQLGGLINEEMCGKIKAVYAFDIKGKDFWHFLKINS